MHYTILPLSTSKTMYFSKILLRFIVDDKVGSRSPNVVVLVRDHQAHIDEIGPIATFSHKLHTTCDLASQGFDDIWQVGFGHLLFDVRIDLDLLNKIFELVVPSRTNFQRKLELILFSEQN